MTLQNKQLMRKLFFLLALCLPALTYSQGRAVGNLTIFSEDGDKFYLVLNGEKQNDIAQANLRIEELPQPYYNAKIIFADSTIATVSKNNLMIADAEGTMMDVTYKIKKDKSRKAKLNYFSAIAVQQDYIPPAGVYVYHYGKPSIVEVSDGTVMTSTTTSNSNTVTANVNAPGISMKIAITDPLMETTTTTTTTTSSSSNSNYNSNVNSNSNSNSRSKCNGWPMNGTDFAAAVKTISNSSFEDSKLSTAKTISSSNCLSSDQVTKICSLFSFEESKLVFAKHAYKRTTDQKNYFKVNNVFSFDSSKEELNKFISED